MGGFAILLLVVALVATEEYLSKKFIVWKARKQKQQA